MHKVQSILCAWLMRACSVRRILLRTHGTTCWNAYSRAESATRRHATRGDFGTSFTILSSTRFHSGGAAARIAAAGSEKYRVRRVPMTALYAYRRLPSILAY